MFSIKFSGIYNHADIFPLALKPNSAPIASKKRRRIRQQDYIEFNQKRKSVFLVLSEGEISWNR